MTNEYVSISTVHDVDCTQNKMLLCDMLHTKLVTQQPLRVAGLSSDTYETYIWDYRTQELLTKVPRLGSVFGLEFLDVHRLLFLFTSTKFNGTKLFVFDIDKKIFVFEDIMSDIFYHTAVLENVFIIGHKFGVYARNKDTYSEVTKREKLRVTGCYKVDKHRFALQERSTVVDKQI